MKKNKSILIIIFTVIILCLDVLAAYHSLIDFTKTYDEWGFAGRVFCLSPYCLAGLVVIFFAAVLIKRITKREDNNK